MMSSTTKMPNEAAKQMGAGKIIATSSNVEKLAVAKSLGADEVINYTESDWAQKVKDAAEAHRQMENRQTTGKIVLIP